MKHRNILYFSSFGTLKGGGQKSLLLLLRRLDRERFAPKCVAPTEGDFCNRLEKQGIPCFVIPMGRPRSIHFTDTIRTIAGVYRLIRREKVHLVHTDGPRNTFFAGMAARFAGIPVVFHVRVTDTFHYFDRILPHLADAFIFVSESARSRFHALSAAKLQRVIYNGIDPSEFEDIRADPSFYGFLKGDPAPFRVGCIGRIEAAKGQNFLLEAVPEIIRRVGETHFFFLGEQDAETMRGLRTLLTPIQGYVHFTGFLDNPYPAMKGLDLVVLPSLSEGFSRSVLEAMALKKAVVATRVGGNPEAVSDGVTGWLVPPCDPGALCDRIVDLLSDPVKRQKMGNAAHERVVKAFDIRKSTREIEEVYSRLLRLP
ncbi:MAG: glycosyltransferase family 4 protein [Deltaproteobacteria bacterium]|nr:glycosyltransferase family 4 protein [Deltaproteobacteria bacterium]